MAAGSFALSRTAGPGPAPAGRWWRRRRRGGAWRCRCCGGGYCARGLAVEGHRIGLVRPALAHPAGEAAAKSAGLLRFIRMASRRSPGTRPRWSGRCRRRTSGCAEPQAAMSSWCRHRRWPRRPRAPAPPAVNAGSAARHAGPLPWLSGRAARRGAIWAGGCRRLGSSSGGSDSRRRIESADPSPVTCHMSFRAEPCPRCAAP
jgi:hypothetical protein